MPKNMLSYEMSEYFLSWLKEQKSLSNGLARAEAFQTVIEQLENVVFPFVEDQIELFQRNEGMKNALVWVRHHLLGEKIS